MSFKDEIVGKLHNVGVIFQREKPTLMLTIASGLIVGGVGVLIYKAADIAETNKKVADTKQEIKDVDEDPVGWSEMGETKFHYIVKNFTVISEDYLKHCGFGAACVGIGLGLAWKSHADMKQTISSLALTAALNANKLTEYRKRVVADQGVEKDYEYYTGQGLKKKVTVDENGTVTETTESVNVPDATYIPHSFLFDESNPNWTPSPQANLNFLTQQLTTINLRLHFQEEMFENEMRDIFGADRTQVAQTAGAFGHDVNGEEQKIRMNPQAMQGLLNGTDPSALIILEYENGTPLDDDILNDERNNIRLY